MLRPSAAALADATAKDATASPPSTTDLPVASCGVVVGGVGGLMSAKG